MDNKEKGKAGRPRKDAPPPVYDDPTIETETTYYGKEKMIEVDGAKYKLMRGSAKPRKRPKSYAKTFLGNPVPNSQKLTDENLPRYIKAFARTGSVSKAARAIGMDRRSIYYIRERYPEFAQMESDAFNDHVEKIYESVVKEIMDGDATNGMRMLAKLDPERFGEKKTIDINQNIKVGVVEIPMGESKLERISEKEITSDDTEGTTEGVILEHEPIRPETQE